MAVGEDALLPVANEIVTTGPVDPNAESSVGLTLLSSMQGAWAASAKSRDMQRSELPYTCPHDYCRWDDVTTLGVGFECRQADVRAQEYLDSGVTFAVSEEASWTNILLPKNGSTTSGVLITRLSIKARSAIPRESKYASRASDLPLILHLAAVGYYEKTYHAAECVLYWSIHEYPSVIIDSRGVDISETEPIEHNKTLTPVFPLTNTTTETLNSTNPATPPSPIVLSGFQTCNFNGTSKPCNYTVLPKYHRGTQELLIPFLSDDSALESRRLPDDYESTHAVDFEKPKIELFYKSWISRVDDNDYPLDDSLARQVHRFMDTMALYLTNNIRTNSNVYAFGTAGSYGPFFAISKHYAAYPAVFLAASMLFVGVTAWRTRRELIWKNSVLAVLFHGLDAGFVGDGGVGRELETMMGMERVGREFYARLEEDSGGGDGDGRGLRLRVQTGRGLGDAG